LKIRIDTRLLGDKNRDLAHNLAILTQRPIEPQLMQEGEYSLTFDIIGGDESDLAAIQALGYPAHKA
jgi:hypothetical protein